MRQALSLQRRRPGCGDERSHCDGCGRPVSGRDGDVKICVALGTGNAVMCDACFSRDARRAEWLAWGPGPGGEPSWIAPAPAPGRRRRGRRSRSSRALGGY